MAKKETFTGHIMPMHDEITSEDINKFFEGSDPMKRIISIELGYDTADAEIVFINDNGEKRIKKEPFKPFVWAKNSACLRMFDGNRSLLKKKMREYGIAIKALYTCREDNPYPNEKLDNGYKYLFYAKTKMSMGKFQDFFKKAGTPINGQKKIDENEPSSQEFMSLQPVEQFMIETGKRYFKGYEKYDDLKRMSFDLETEGLNPLIHCISQIGIRTNKGFEKILTITGDSKEEKEKNELYAINEFIKIIATEAPDVIFGHNSENFDWDFIIVRCEKHGIDFKELSEKYLREGIYKKSKPTTLKLGGEVETFFQTIIKYHNVVDSLHAVRRAMATDSSFEKANLKYATQYLKLNKKNRVYVPGNIIESTWRITDNVYAFNDKNGDWYKITEEKPLQDGYELVSGKYIVERYLLDDLWECDKVELSLHETDFHLTKMIPTTFPRVCTMGTATQWKLILLTWAYEHNMAVPSLGKNKKYTGGLSRLLVTGYIEKICKGDYAALYPTTEITWNIEPDTDFTHVTLKLLTYVLTKREFHKELKKTSEKEAEKLYNILNGLSELDSSYQSIFDKREKILADKIFHDNQQLVLKKLANSWFGSLGCPNVNNWGDLNAAEKTTCIGRMLLRIMIWFLCNDGRGDEYKYIPIVGDTDGFDFKLPQKFKYTKDNPYIGKGLNRYVKEGKEYINAEADFAEFNDTYLNKCYNGSTKNMSANEIDEYVDSSINFSRKNYCCKMQRDGSIKKVGNTVKSRKMSGYLQKFLDKALSILIEGKGKEFLEMYYDYIDDIYNYRISVRDIASKGNIKKSLKEYKDDCNTLTKAGSKKSRQAWYELAIRENLNVNPGDTIYYVNTGTKKSESDAKRITHQFVMNPENQTEEVELIGKVKTSILKKECEKNGIDYKTLKTKERKEILSSYIVREEDEVILNCKLVPFEVMESENDLLCSDIPDLEYNVEKYIDQFNNRITPLLVCFHPRIRGKILIKNPSDRQYWTDNDAVLVSGYPMKPEDQDTYEALMTPERKEIEFWEKIGERPPFVDECGIEWEKLVEEYHEIVKREADELFQAENNKYLEALDNLTKDDISAFEEDGVIPKPITDIVTLSPKDMRFYFIRIPDMTPTTGGYIFDDMKISMEEHGIETEAFIPSLED